MEDSVKKKFKESDEENFKQELIFIVSFFVIALVGSVLIKLLLH